MSGRNRSEDVAVGEHGRGDERGVPYLDTVVCFVALFEPAQDRDRVRDRRLADEHGLEPPLERGVLLDVPAVLVECRRTDGAELAACEHRLQHVGRVNGAFGRPRADDRVELVDEENDLAGCVLNLREDGLEPLLELAAVLRARKQRSEVERPDALSFQPLRDIAGNDALSEPLDDGRLPDAWLPDQNRVVLRPPREDLDDAPDLLVATDDGVELARLGEGGQIAPVLLERLVRALGILRRHALPAAHVLKCREQGVPRDHVERKQQVFYRYVLVTELAHLVERSIENATETSGRLRLDIPAGGRRLLLQPRLGLRTELRRSVAGSIGERARQLLVEDGDGEVVGSELGIAHAAGELLRACDGLL